MGGGTGGGGAPAGGEPGLGGGLDDALGGLGDDGEDELTFGDGFDIPLDGLPEFFTPAPGGGPGDDGEGALGSHSAAAAGGTSGASGSVGGGLVARVAAVAEYDSLADITGEESGARAALGLTDSQVAAGSTGGAAAGGGVAGASDAGGWGNYERLREAYVVRWQQMQVRCVRDSIAG